MKLHTVLNSLPPLYVAAWYRWIIISGTAGVICILTIGIISLQQCIHAQHLKKQVQCIKKSIDDSIVHHQKTLQQHHDYLIQIVRTFRQWEKNSGYYDHVHAISATIPTHVALLSLSFDQTDCLLTGETPSIEYVLEFLHALEQTHLFQNMNITTLRASDKQYNKQNLVIFTIKGILSYGSVSPTPITPNTYPIIS